MSGITRQLLGALLRALTIPSEWGFSRATRGIATSGAFYGESRDLRLRFRPDENA